MEKWNETNEREVFTRLDCLLTKTKPQLELQAQEMGTETANKT